MSLNNEHENESEIPHEENESLSTESSQSGWRSVWNDNKGMFLVILAEWVGSSMDAMVRFLQQGGHGMHPFQVIVARMSMTFILSNLYMWYTSVPDYPFGNAKVRGWLILRACFGFGGLFCLYYSVHYLPLAEATVFRFLVPVVTAWACSLFLGQRFRRAEFLAGIIALIGVIFIAHPEFIFGRVTDAIDADKAGDVDDVTSTQRLIAIVVSLLGVIGASGAYTTIRIIGNRAHALMSVNYFAILGTIGSTIALLVIPGIGFSMPRGAREWVLLLLLGVLGFVLQFLLTAGLQMDKSSKATSMMYTQVIFALGFDWAIWGVLPSAWSWFGGAIVVGEYALGGGAEEGGGGGGEGRGW
ncbi:putative transport protein [Lachnellula hyalina]|uniref:Putative transport protein n=1 Tax=Lachnellula hyalina TaxID=1316788 RepID=A0A8H8R3S8_9HELO|nr:putative transport protein [Lachnellula hyalina]TVY27918.1 putative transport protein [Lachnellula hyalina]